MRIIEFVLRSGMDFVVTPTLNIHAAPPQVGSGTGSPSSACSAAVQPIICIWAPAIRRLYSAQGPLAAHGQIIYNSQSDHFTALRNLMSFGPTLDATLPYLRSADPRSWMSELPEILGGGLLSTGEYLDLALNLDSAIQFVNNTFGASLSPEQYGNPRYRQAADDALALCKRLYLVFGLSHVAVIQEFFRQNYSSLLAARDQARRVHGCSAEADAWFMLNGRERIGVGSPVRFCNPLWYGTTVLGIVSLPGRGPVNPESMRDILSIGRRASVGEVATMYLNYQEGIDFRTPMLAPEVMACGGATS